MTIDEALGEIHKARNEKSLNYCVNYAQHALAMWNGLVLSTPKDMSVQLLYVLNNMSHWKGEVAKEVRQTLKDYVKQNSK